MSTVRAGSPRRKLRTPLALLLGVLCAVSVLEIVARLCHEAPWYERLESEQTARPIRWRRNQYGLRGPDHAGPRLATTRRVLLIGDSFTFGEGVEDGALIFPAVLERELNDGPRPAGVERVEILNGGIPGSHSQEWVDLWAKVGAAFAPDVVVVVFFLRDGSRVSAKKGFFDPIRKDIVLRNRDSRLYQSSYAFRMLRDRLDRAHVERLYADAIGAAYFGDESQTEEWRNAQANLAKLRDLARAQGATFGFVVFPILVELNEDYPFRPVCELLVDFAEENGMPTLDLLPAFLGQDGPDLWVAPLNQHPNPAGHAIAARALLPFLRGLLESHEQE